MPKKVSDAARLLSARGASRGGKARAKALSPARRKEIAQLGVKSRWRKAKVQTTDLFGHPLQGRFAIIEKTDDFRSFLVSWDPLSKASHEHAKMKIEYYRRKIQREPCTLIDCRLDVRDPLMIHTERWCLTRSVAFVSE